MRRQQRQQRLMEPHERAFYRDRMDRLARDFKPSEGPGLIAAQTVFLGAVAVAMTMAVAGAVIQ